MIPNKLNERITRHQTDRCFKPVLNRWLRTHIFQLAFIFTVLPAFSAPPVENNTSSTRISTQDESPQLIGHYGSWKAYTCKEDKHAICYMVTRPVQQKGDIPKRGAAYLIITHRPHAKSFNVISQQYGYPLASNQKTSIVLYGREMKEGFALIPEGETAWAHDGKMDNALTNIVITWGSRAVLTGANVKGIVSEDTYRLIGAAKAYKAISKACAVQPLDNLLSGK